VEIRWAVVTFPAQGVVGVAQVEARNWGDLPVRVTSAGFELQDGSSKVLVIAHQPSGATLPGVISPRDSGSTYLLEGALARIVEALLRERRTVNPLMASTRYNFLYSPQAARLWPQAAAAGRSPGRTTPSWTIALTA
jgi:hypothetical protein